MILVAGATGTVGHEVVAKLAELHQPVRALVHNPQRAEPLRELEVELVQGDYEKPESLLEALRGVDRLYLVSPLRPDLGILERQFVQQAQRAGVQRVVKQSVMGADAEALAVGRWHRASERAIESSGMAWTHLRPVFFMSNLLGFAQSIRQDGMFAAPTGKGKLSLIHPGDIAAAAVAVLTQSGHEGRAYTLSGPRTFDFFEVAELMSQRLHREVRFADVTAERFRASMDATGTPDWAIDALIEMYRLVKAGFGGPVTRQVELLTGTPARPLEQWLDENLTFFQ